MKLCFLFQGKDIKHKHDRKVRRTEPRSQDVYIRLLVKVSRNFNLKVYIVNKIYFKVLIIYPMFKCYFIFNLHCVKNWYCTPSL